MYVLSSMPAADRKIRLSTLARDRGRSCPIVFALPIQSRALPATNRHRGEVALGHTVLLRWERAALDDLRELALDLIKRDRREGNKRPLAHKG